MCESFSDHCLPVLIVIPKIVNSGNKPFVNIRMARLAINKDNEAIPILGFCDCLIHAIRGTLSLLPGRMMRNTNKTATIYISSDTNLRNPFSVGIILTLFTKYF